MTALQRGGYTIVLRHARTDRSFQEEIAAVPVERSKQRNLSADGVEDAKLMGIVLRKYAIPIGEIIASPMFRTRETAEAAAGVATTTMALRTFPATPEAAALLAATPKSGSNRLIVTHHFIIETFVPGIRPGDIGESEAAVVRPTGDGKVELVGKILLNDWRTLAGSTPASAPSASYGANAHHGGETNGQGLVVKHDAPIMRLARGYVEAFNSGDEVRMRSFVESSMVANPDRPVEERMKTYATLFAEHGALALTELVHADEHEITLGMTSKAGPLRLTVKESATEPGRAASITFTSSRGGHS